MKERIFVIPLSITFENPKILGFRFLYKKYSVNQLVKYEKLNYRKS